MVMKRNVMGRNLLRTIQKSLGRYAAALVLVSLSILIINRGQQEKA